MLGWFNFAKRLQVVEDMALKLDRRMDEAELDYADMRARCKRLLDRTEKAAERLATTNPTEEPTVPSEDAPQGGRLLTPRQMQIQRHILSRRARHPELNGGS